MTLVNQSNTATFQGNGATTQFSYGFWLPEITDALVYLTDGGTTTLLTPDAYSLTSGTSGGTLTYSPPAGPLPSGAELTLVRQTIEVQATSFNPQGDVNPTSLELLLDTIVAQIQDIALFGAHAVRGPLYDTTMAPLPAAAARANGFLAFDANGNPYAVSGTTLPGVPVSSVMEPVVAASTAATALTLLGGVSSEALAAFAYVQPLMTIAALRSATSATLVGTVAVVEGYYAPNDGGGGIFFVQASDTTGADNGGTIFVDASGRRWYRQSAMSGVVTDRQFGARVDNLTDDAPAIQAAVNWVGQQGGGKVILTPGVRLMNGTVDLVNPSVIVEGFGWGDYQGWQGEFTPGQRAINGSWIRQGNVSNSCFYLFQTSNHVNLRGIGFFQTQPPDGAGWTPTVYAPTISCQSAAGQPGGSALLEDLFCWNCYEFIRVGAVGLPASRITMKHIWGMPLAFGIRIYFSSDVNRLEDIHFWQFDEQVPNIIAWVQANGCAITTCRSDNFQAVDVFTYGYNVGTQWLSSADGSTQNWRIVNVEHDSCHVGFQFDVTSGACIGHATNCHHQDQASQTSGYGIFVTGTAPVTVDWVNFKTDFAALSGIATNASSDMSFTNLRVNNWNQSGGTLSAVTGVTGGIMTFSGRYVTTGGNGGGSAPSGGTNNNTHVN